MNFKTILEVAAIALAVMVVVHHVQPVRKLVTGGKYGMASA